jgi:hypothetical protein
MAAAIYLHSASSSFEWHRRMIGSVGLEFLPTTSLGEALEQMDERQVSMVLLSPGGDYRLEETVFPIKARHGQTKVLILSPTHAPDRVPSHIDAWICITDHEEIVRSRLRRFIEQ